MMNITNYKTINAESKKETLTNKYSFIPTNRVVETLAKQNWYPSKVVESRVNDKINEGFQKHSIRFRMPEMMQSKVGDTIPEIVLTNSHNGLSAFNILLGLWRQVCSNGAVVSEGTFETQRITHKGFTDEKVIDAVYKVMDAVPLVSNKVETFRNIALSDEERRLFAESTLPIFYDEETLGKEKVSLPATISQMLRPSRSEDRDNNLWNTYNIIQERMIKGRMYLMSNRGYPIQKSRQIKAIDKDIRINKALWTLTEKMAQLKGFKV